MEHQEALHARHVPAWDAEVDAVVVGYGIAGACAALEICRGEASVLVLERDGVGGGASALSSGIFYLGGGTALQRETGIEDDSGSMYDFLVMSGAVADEAIARAYCEDAPAHFDWLERQGLPFARTAVRGKALARTTDACLFLTGNEKGWPYREVARPAPRGHKVSGSGEGAGFIAMQALLARCEEAGVTSCPNSAVDALVMDGQEVVGVRYRQDGQVQRVRAHRGVVLATGSYAMHPTLMQELRPELPGHSQPLGMAYNDGAGLGLGRSAGGVVRGLGEFIATGPIYPPDQLTKGILINAEGRRFVAEDSYQGKTAAATFDQPGLTAYLIVDSRTFAYPEVESTGHRFVDGWETVAEMEAELVLPEGSLQRTLDEYNAHACDGTDPYFKKHPDLLQPLDAPPYAAFDVSPTRSTYAYMTLGGLRVDVDGRVLRDDAQAVPGLYAVGACAVTIGRTGRDYASGLSLGPGSYFGRRAGRHLRRRERAVEPPGRSVTDESAGAGHGA